MRKITMYFDYLVDCQIIMIYTQVSLSLREIEKWWLWEGGQMERKVMLIRKNFWLKIDGYKEKGQIALT
jgi:hypothetical protein